MSEGGRVCPICDMVTDETVCPDDKVPTVDRNMLDQRWEDRLKPGMMIANRFRVEGFLGGGSMGGVYHCIQVNMQRPVALKTLKQEFMSDSKMLKRFYLEARAASRLDHPNIVRVYDFGVDEEHEVPYIAMEYLIGDDMRTMLYHRERLPEREAAYLVSQIVKALVNAHENGIVHRDLKPANIHIRQMSGGDVHCKVLDFGIAKVLQGNDESTSNLTGTGMAMGTALYMSPEQILGKPVDFRTDLYAVGCILYELCSGETPFAGEDVAVLVRHLDESIPELPDKLVDGEKPTDAIRYVLGRLMAKDPAERPGSTANVALALECLARGEPVDMKNLLDSTVPDPDPHAENPDVVMPMGDATAATMAQGVISADAAAGMAGRAEAGSLQGGGGTVAWDSVDPPLGSDSA
ncbi:MAG: serine/threonine-protein kinase, partial [Myxococcota bacterium]|nr:serine/threonine-protein kinase [Myxococcota bacterium]